jgi:hypothetical protein
LVRQHCIADIDKIADCRMRFSWCSTNKPDAVTSAVGVWGETALPPFKPIHTLRKQPSKLRPVVHDPVSSEANKGSSRS